jgi:hypothetical protein
MCPLSDLRPGQQPLRAFQIAELGEGLREHKNGAARTSDAATIE